MCVCVGGGAAHVSAAEGDVGHLSRLCVLRAHRSQGPIQVTVLEVIELNTTLNAIGRCVAQRQRKNDDEEALHTP